MPVISIIGPKGGIGKTTLSINTAAALTRSLGKSLSHDSVCLFDLDLRLPTISSILERHPFLGLLDSAGELLHTPWRVSTSMIIVLQFKSSNALYGIRLS